MTDNQEQPRKKNQKLDNRAKDIEEKIANGPQEERKCTDILCCLLFVAFMVFMVYVGAQGFADGDPKRLVAVYDSSYLPCGLKTDGEDGKVYDLTDYKYVYFPIPHPSHLDTTYCVKECPEIDQEAGEDADSQYPNGISCNTYNQTSEYGNKFSDNKCTNDCDMNDLYTNSDDLEGKFCIYNTRKLLGRVCFPGAEVIDSVANLAKGITDAINMDKINEYLDDLEKGKAIVCASVGFVFVLGILYMLFVRVFSGIIVWLIIALYFVLMGLLTYFLYDKYKETDDYLKENDGQEQGDYTNSNKNLYLSLSIVFLSIFVLSLIGLICLWKSIRLAIAIIKTATIFMVDVPSALVVPIIMAIFVAGWWILWAFAFMYVYSVGDIYKRSEGSVFATVDWEEQQEYYVWSFVFGGLWVNAFLQALTQFTLASTCSIWYWDQPDKTPHRPVLRSFYRAFRYHLGSLAFGSLILAIVQTIRLMLEYVYKQYQKTGQTQNKIVKYIFTCLRCCIACFERFVKFMNRIAYVQIALSGDNFCSSAILGMTQVFNNKARVMLVSGLGWAFIFVGKLFMIIANVFICYMIYTEADPWKSEMTSTWLPLLIILVLSWGISTVFLSVYSMAIDTVMLCFLYDEKINSSNQQAKMKAPEPLAEFFKEHNEKAEKLQSANQQQQKP